MSSANFLGPRTAILAALEWEVAVAREALRRGPGTAAIGPVLCCGIGEERVAKVLAALRPKPDGLILLGCAGGLAPALRSGDLVVADRIVDASGETFACDPAGRAAMEAAARRGGVAATVGGVLGSGAVIASVDEKRRAASASGCVAVDMESSAAARWAAANGIPLAVVRAILDPADVALEYALLCVDPSGAVSLPGVARALVRGRAAAVRELVGLGRARRAAGETLGRVCAALAEPAA